jgi:putative solute:sodium symporter small subunit
MKPQQNNNAYWKENIKYLSILMFAWFFVSFGCGILLADFFNQFQIGGFPLGFWFAQQGSIYAFIIIIAVYIRLMKKLDQKYNLND